MPPNDSPAASEPDQARPGQSLLELLGLSRAFGGLHALEDVSFAISAGEIVAIVGPNGAGKTTLLNLVTGFLKPDRGTVRFRGTPIERFPPHVINGLGIARTFQQIRLFGRMTVLENCLAGMHLRFQTRVPAVIGRTRGFRTELRQRTEEARGLLEEFGLLADQSRLAGTLPYGQQRRLEIARALGSRPSLLCLDEPAAGMNEIESQTLIDAIRGLPARGTNVMLIEHDMRVVRGLSHRVIVLNEGSVITSGIPAEALAHPEVIRAYLGSPHA